MFFANFLSETISCARQQIVEKRKTECFDCYCFDFGQSDCDIWISRVFPVQLFVLKLKTSQFGISISSPFASSFITAKMELNRKSKAKNCAESPDSKKRRESDPIFDDCKLIQAKKAQIKLLKNQTEKRKAQLHRDIGIIAMTKEVDGAFEKALEYLTKSWKVCKIGCSNKFWTLLY